MADYITFIKYNQYKIIINIYFSTKINKNYLILNVESLKYISQTRDFNKIIEYAEEAV